MTFSYQNISSQFKHTSEWGSGLIATSLYSQEMSHSVLLGGFNMSDARV